MKATTFFDWNIKKNIRYILAILLCHLVIPLIPVSNPNFPALLDNLRGDSGLHLLYLLCCWFCIPISAGIIAGLHSASAGKLSPVLLFESTASIFLLAFRLDFKSVLYLLLSVLIIFLMEAVNVVNAFSFPHHKRLHRLCAGMQTNRKFLIVCSFWFIAFPLAVQVYLLHMSHYWDYRSLPYILTPVILALFLHGMDHFVHGPLTKGGILGVFIIFLLSLPAITLGPMGGWWKQNLLFQTIGLAALLIAEAIFNTRRKHI